MTQVPSDWKDFTFGDIVTFSGGAQPPRSTFKFEEQKGYVRLIQTRDYKTDKYKTFIPEELARKRCDKDDIMIGRYGPPIFQILRGLEGAYNVALLKAIPNENELNKEYLYYFISQYSVWAFVENLSQRSGGQTGVDLEQLRKFSFPLPPLAEQQKIAEILSTVDDKIEVIDQQIKETKELKKGLMQRLLTKGIGHTEFKDSPMGEIPVGWEVVKSSQVFELIHGYQFRDYDFTEQGLPIVKIGQINRNGEIDMSDCSFIAEERAEEFADKRIFNGDVLMALTGATLGKSCWVSGLEGDVYQNYRVGKFEPLDKEELSKRYLYYLVGSPLVLNQIFAKINSGAQGNIGKSDFEKLNITLPSLAEQNQIANILDRVDQKKKLLTDKKLQYEQLKKGLMQQLLTGKVRVKI
jgi:type I restriction enzyme S subunit